jgi:hypothetical protein
VTHGSKIVQSEDVAFGESDLQIDASHENHPSTPASQPLGSGLEAVPMEAIDIYCSVLGRSYGIPEQNKFFFGYFYQPSMRGNIMVFDPMDIMKGVDAVAALRAAAGIHLTDAYLLQSLIPVNANNLNAEVNISLGSFPEYAYFHQNPIRALATQPASPYFNLMKFPPRGRTFFAGVLHDKSIQDVPGVIRATKDIILPVSTKDVIDYSKKIGIRDVAEYLQMFRG